MFTTANIENQATEIVQNTIINHFKQRRFENQQAGKPDSEPIITPAESAIFNQCRESTLMYGLLGSFALALPTALLFRFASKLRTIKASPVIISAITGGFYGAKSSTRDCMVKLLSLPTDESEVANLCREALKEEVPDAELYKEVKKRMESGGNTTRTDFSWKLEDAKLKEIGETAKKQADIEISQRDSMNSIESKKSMRSIKSMDSMDSNGNENEHQIVVGSHNESPSTMSKQNEHNTNEYTNEYNNEYNNDNSNYNSARGASSDSNQSDAGYDGNRYPNYDDRRENTNTEGWIDVGNNRRKTKPKKSLRIDEQYDLLHQGEYDSQYNNDRTERDVPRQTTWEEIRQRNR